MKLLTSCLLFFMLTFLSYAQNTWYIHNGAVNGNGSEGSPFNSWTDAMTALHAGDILYVMPGRYDITKDIRPQNSGTLANPITITASDPSDQPVITPGDGVRDHLLYFAGISNYVVENIEFDGEWVEDQLIWLMPLEGDVNIPNENLTFRNCKFHRSSRDGFGVLETHNLVIDNCEIAYCINYSDGERKDAHGIGYGSGRKLTVLNSNIHHTSGDGIQCGAPLEFPTWDSAIVINTEIWCEQLTEELNGAPAGTWLGENAFDTKTPDSIDIDAIQPGYRGYVYLEHVVAHGFYGQDSWAAFSIKFTVDATLKNCVAYGSGTGYRIRGSYAWGRGVRGAWVTMINCIAYDNYWAALWPEENIERANIWNCTFDRPESGHYFDNRTQYKESGWDLRNSIFVGDLPDQYIDVSEPTIFSATPADFVGYSEHDYKLAFNSMAVNAGDNIPEVDIDFNGVPRVPDHYDIGAFEADVPENPVYVTNISIAPASGVTSINRPGETLMLKATVTPTNATLKAVTWSIGNGTGEATINAGGLVTAISPGTVTVLATANDGTNIQSNELLLTILNQTPLDNPEGLFGVIYPNPCTDDEICYQFYDSAYSQSEELSYTLRLPDGKLVLEKHVVVSESNKVTLAIEGISPGIYILSIRNSRTEQNHLLTKL